MSFCFACFRDPTNTRVSKEATVNHTKENAAGGSKNVGQKNSTKTENAKSSRRIFCISLETAKSKRRQKNSARQTNASCLEDTSGGRQCSSKGLFLWLNGRRKSTTCSGGGGPTYDYIDTVNDPVYSKVNENPNNSYRYDYPAFAAAAFSRRRAPQAIDPFYTSTSQIYYMASDDPYSSIVSDSRQHANYELESNSSGIYDVGYEKVSAVARKASQSQPKPPIFRQPGELAATAAAAASKTPSLSGNIDALYAKINRLPNGMMSKSDSTNTQSPTCSATFDAVSGANNNAIYRQQQHQQQQPQLQPQSQAQQQEESGSGSVGSIYTGTGSSQNPSYRYLTIREPVDVIRERIRRQELQRQQDDNYSTHLPHREHYYSTIANEYESVGGGDERSLAGGFSSSAQNSAENSTSSERSLPHARRQQSVFRLFPNSSSITSPLSLLTGRFHYSTSTGRGGQNMGAETTTNDANRPKPPTSPIPDRSLDEVLPTPRRLLPPSSSSTSGTRPVILSPTLPLPDSLKSEQNSGKLSRSYTNLASSTNAVFGGPVSIPSNNLACGAAAKPIDDARVRNSSAIFAPLSIIKSYNNASAAKSSATDSQHRFSYTYDPTSAAFGAQQQMLPQELQLNRFRREENGLRGAPLTRRNRISAPISHLHANFAVSSDSTTPPPLPPLPTPCKGVNYVLQELRKAVELSENAGSESSK